MRILIEFKLVERYLILDIPHLIMDKKYKMSYTTCPQIIKYKLIFVQSLFGKGT